MAAIAVEDAGGGVFFVEDGCGMIGVGDVLATDAGADGFSATGVASHEMGLDETSCKFQLGVKIMAVYGYVGRACGGADRAEHGCVGADMIYQFYAVLKGSRAEHPVQLNF